MVVVVVVVVVVMVVVVLVVMVVVGLQPLTSPPHSPLNKRIAGRFEFIPIPKPALIAELGNKHRRLVVLRPTNSGVPIICVLYKTKTSSTFVCFYHSISEFCS